MLEPTSAHLDKNDTHAVTMLAVKVNKDLSSCMSIHDNIYYRVNQRIDDVTYEIFSSVDEIDSFIHMCITAWGDATMLVKKIPVLPESNHPAYDTHNIARYDKLLTDIKYQMNYIMTSLQRLDRTFSLNEDSDMYQQLYQYGSWILFKDTVYMEWARKMFEPKAVWDTIDESDILLRVRHLADKLSSNLNVYNLILANANPGAIIGMFKPRKYFPNNDYFHTFVKESNDIIDLAAEVAEKFPDGVLEYPTGDIEFAKTALRDIRKNIVGLDHVLTMIHNDYKIKPNISTYTQLFECDGWLLYCNKIFNHPILKLVQWSQS